MGVPPSSLGACQLTLTPPLCPTTVGAAGGAPGGEATGQEEQLALVADQTGWISSGTLLTDCVSYTHGPTSRTWLLRGGGTMLSIGTISECRIGGYVPWRREATWVVKLSSPAFSADRGALGGAR